MDDSSSGLGIVLIATLLVTTFTERKRQDFQAFVESVGVVVNSWISIAVGRDFCAVCEIQRFLFAFPRSARLLPLAISAGAFAVPELPVVGVATQQFSVEPCEGELRSPLNSSRRRVTQFSAPRIRGAFGQRYLYRSILFP